MFDEMSREDGVDLTIINCDLCYLLFWNIINSTKRLSY